jgi:hypothetical protein
MSVTELPVDIVSSRNAGSFVLGNHALRSAWANSFYIPANANVAYLTTKIETLSPRSNLHFDLWLGLGGVLEHPFSPFVFWGEMTQKLRVLS